jgi:hypothetical protein
MMRSLRYIIYLVRGPPITAKNALNTCIWNTSLPPAVFAVAALRQRARIEEKEYEKSSLICIIISLSRAAKRLNCFSHLFKLDQNYYTKADSSDSISGAPASDEKKKRSRERDGWILHWTPRKIYRLDAWSLNQNRIEKRRAHAKI